jgi:replication factor C subunit 3/5
MKTSIPWIEKYRPSHFDDIVLDPLNRIFFQNIIYNNCFPNLLLYGTPGVGKTSSVINLIQEYQRTNNIQNHIINKGNIIHLNASDERGIDTIRNQIHQFVSTNNLFDTGLKFVILDEVDYMTKNAQQALKYLLQTSGTNVRFCLICNYVSKIDESLQNEFICVRFNQLPKTEIFTLIRNISEKEKIPLNDSIIEKIQAIYQSDIRSMINFIQSNHHSLTDSIINKTNSSILHSDIWREIHTKLMKADENIFKYIHKISIEYNIDKRQILLNYFNYVIRNYQDIITKEFLDIVEIIMHNNENTPIETIVGYFIVQCIKCYKKMI